MKKIIPVIILFLVTTISSCYYDKADYLYPTSGNCDTAAISYNKNLVPLFQSQCYSCHSPSSASGGIVMGTYATDKAIALNGKLYGSVSHASGFSPMPAGAAKMTTCQLAGIKKWIDAGCPNN